MNKDRAVYDTRFFVEFFYSKETALQKKFLEEKSRKEKYVSSIVVHELYNLSLLREGKETAQLRVSILKKDFKTIPVDDHIAQISAEMRQKYNLSMGDSMIAATACVLDAVCVSDDPHFLQIKEIKTTWIQ